jgi:steroid delta-isomerase-like uncharacterized protein
MSAEENKALIRRFVDFIDQGKVDEAVQLTAPDVIFHYPGGDDVVGQAALQERAQMLLSAFPDLKHIFEDLFAVDDKVVVRYTIRGTHQGELKGMAPTGHQVTFTAISIYIVSGGDLSEAWIESDQLGLVGQLGAGTATKP